MIKLAIVGYGKMGKITESLINPGEFEIIGKYDIINPVNEHLRGKPDVAIEFSTPSTVIENIEFLAKKGINVVCGTTGWYDKIDEVKKIIKKNNTGFVYASNFSVGVNIFFQIAKYAAEIINKYGQYNISVEETHHTQKLDKPSGTALRIAEYLTEKIKRKKTITNDRTDLLESELNIISKRIENVVGNHKIFFSSQSDTITLEHNANSRRGFAEGALLAAKFIHNKKGFYKFDDIFNNLT
jgi:4-hydroxy-tetrahydrodipicolinate reductase